MLEETGIDYTTEIVAYGSKMQGASFRAMNPMGKVPAIRHGEIIISEGAAICVPGGRLPCRWPGSPTQRP